MDDMTEQMMVEVVLDYNRKHYNQFVDFRIVNFPNNCNYRMIERMEVAAVRQLVVVEQLVVVVVVVILVHFSVTNHDVYD